ncbi:MAG: LPS export ABC transporter permease LptG [Cardiobacteriaceae bacterium]|nr:LPS export ABC transporter permease LptG [Cardiobacteriaceae bacterium]
MRRLDRYIIRTVLVTTAIALLFLTGMDFLIQSAAEADDLGNHYSFAVMLLTLLLQLPEKILLFMPAAVLIGGIIGLGQLASQNELTVLLASGISRLRAVFAAILTAFVLGLLAVLLGETIAPQWSMQSQLLRAQARGESTDYRGNGLWLRDDDAMVHIAGIDSDGSLRGLRFYHNTADGITISEAGRARHAAPDWLLENAVVTRVTPERMDTMPGSPQWQNGAPPAILQTLAASHQAGTLRELHTLTRFLAANGLSHNQESLKLWQRLFLPLSTVTMLLLALPFVFGGARSTHQGSRLVIGILCGVAYYIAQGILANLALLYHWPPVLGAFTPIFLFALFPLLLLRHR